MLLKKSVSAFVAALAIAGLLVQPVVAADTTPFRTSAPVAPVSIDISKGIEFAHDHSDLLADPKARFGRLPNGMTYVIYRNATPPGTASVRLRVGAGSLMEGDDQQGLAHFLEHMAFNGSANVPEGEMVRILERHGLKFGPDTNAYTSFDETVYELDLPKVGEDDVDTALFLMRETAGNLTLDAAAIDRERDVVLGEERLRASPGLRHIMRYFAEVFDGQKLPNRLPIGKTDILKNAGRDRFADFYGAFYRPELMTLVVVGDIDPDAIEAKIKSVFGSAQPALPGPVRVTDFGAYRPKGLTVGSYYEPGVSEGLSVTWVRPLDTEFQTLSQVVDDLPQGLAVAALNERFERAAQSEETPFAAASFSISPLPHSGELVGLDVTPKPGKVKEAFEAAWRMVRQFQSFGVTQPELDRALTNMDAGLKAQLQGADTRNNSSIAEGIVASVNDGSVFSSPAQDVALFDALRPGLTVEVINASIAKIFSGDGPYLWHSGVDDGGFDDAALRASYESVLAEQLTATQARDNKAWPYTEFGPASALKDRKEVADLGIVQLTYANGVRVNIKTTDFKDEEVNVVVTFAGGLRSLSPDGKPPLFQANALGVFDGGLGKLEAADIRDSLTGKIYGVDFSIDEDSTNLSGSTTRTDFATQMQVLMAFTTDAAYREDAFSRLKSFVPNYYSRIDTAPGGVFSFNAPGLLHSGDARFAMPSEAEFLATSNEAVKALIETPLKTAAVEITIVGDITEAEARAQVEATFAALPIRRDIGWPAASTASAAFPVSLGKVTLSHKGRPDQGLYFMAWPTSDFFADTRQTRGLQLLSNVLSLRLTDEVRERQALAYSPNAGINASMAFPGYGYLSVSGEVKPEAMPVFDATVLSIIADLQAKPISDDELLRARKPELDRLENDWKTNGYWVRLLPGSNRDPRLLDAIRSRGPQLRDMDAAYLQQLAKTFLTPEKAVRIVVSPAQAE